VTPCIKKRENRHDDHDHHHDLPGHHDHDNARNPHNRDDH
jgi:hypothetical protein